MTNDKRVTWDDLADAYDKHNSGRKKLERLRCVILWNGR